MRVFRLVFLLGLLLAAVLLLALGTREPAGAARRFVASRAAAPTIIFGSQDTATVAATPAPSTTGFSRRGTRRVAPSPSATPAAPTITPIPPDSPTPTATPRPPSFGTLDHALVYDDHSQMILLLHGSTRPAGLAPLSAGSHRNPRFSGGWQYIYYNNGFWLGDIYGHQTQIIPPLVTGEQVFDAFPSPDGQYIAWDLTRNATTNDGIVTNLGASRIVVTDQSGGNARTVVQQDMDSSDGGVPIIYGWRPVHPPTLLVQYAYSSAANLGLHRGLEEFDVGIDDMVGDYLPPLGESGEALGEALGLSPTGRRLAYATVDQLLPSGEGPYPATLYVMSTSVRHTALIDDVRHRKDTPPRGWPQARAYTISRQAYISPDDRRIAYTRLDIYYLDGHAAPTVRPIACLAGTDGAGKVELGQNEEVRGWADTHTVIVLRVHSRANGLYAVDLRTGVQTLLSPGNDLRVDGIVP